MGNKKALLVGCNYPGTKAELNGCVNDALGMKEMLKNYFGFTDQEILLMIDTDKNSTQPTGRNIKRELIKIVSDSRDGDMLFMHFSGHGTQVKSNNPGEEKDGKDEAICPTDMNIIADDDLRIILEPLSKKPGVKFTLICDCCHSGTILDHEEVQITGPKTGGPPLAEVDAQSVQNMLASLGASRDASKNRSLPESKFLEALSDVLGTPVEKISLSASMVETFGEDASSRVRTFISRHRAPAITTSTTARATTATKKERGFLSSLFGCSDGLATSAIAPIPSMTQHGSDPAAKPNTTFPDNGTSSNVLNPDVGILISGCQDSETSADLMLNNDPSTAYGAMSNAVQTIVRVHYENYPGQVLTYRNLVLAVRRYLAQAKFAQNPCLECSDKFVDSQFILQ